MHTVVEPTVSVVIASHRQDYVEGCLQAFGPPVWGSVSTEVIVAADYAVDVLAPRYPWVRWVYHPDRNIPAKRNIGVRESRAEIVAFIDDDCFPDPGWVVNGAAFMQSHTGISGVMGQTLIASSSAPGASYTQFKRLEQQGYRTNNVFFRKQALVEAGLFDERFVVQREDLDLAFTLLESGLEIGFDERTVVRHRYRQNEKWDLLKNCINRRFDPLLHHKHPRLYRKHIRSPFTPSIGVLLLCHASLVFWAVVRMPGAFVPCALDMLVILVLTARRTRTSRIGVLQWAREYLSYAVSPVVLLGALVYGSVRFRAFLIV